MASPFPGMDPYLEDAKSVAHFSGTIGPQPLSSLVARPSWTITGHAWPSVITSTSRRLFTSIIREEHHEQYIEIRKRSDGKLVTLVDVVSPANKVTPAGRTAYLDRRQEGRNCKSNLVEIDLVMQGQPMLDYSREGLPDWDYAVTVTRATQPERYEIYTATLGKTTAAF